MGNHSLSILPQGIRPLNLADYAKVYCQTPESVSSRDNFLLRLALNSDSQSLLELIDLYNLEPLIALPISQRLLKISANPDQLTIAAKLLYAHGFDDEAHELIQAALAHNPDHCPALLMSAQLCPDIVERKRILTRILVLDPTGMEAFENLVMLRTAADEITAQRREYPEDES